MKIRALITHKISEEFADCQDRFAINNATMSVAVSDGMGMSWHQKIWARLLVDTFVESSEWQPTHDAIKPLCSKWKEEVNKFIQHLRETNAPESLIFRNERNLAEGRSAGATFVGIRFDGCNWSGTVLGDSCLIEWDGFTAIFHTSQDVDAFDSYPDYFDSATDKQGKGTPKPVNGTLAPGKTVFLVSDPFSDFLLEHQKKGDIANYVQQLLGLNSHADFETLVESWRSEGMHNDDTTLVIVEHDDEGNFILQTCDDLATLIEQERTQKEAAVKGASAGAAGEQENLAESVERGNIKVAIDRKTFLDEISGILNKHNFKRKIVRKIIQAIDLLLDKYHILK